MPTYSGKKNEEKLVKTHIFENIKCQEFIEEIRESMERKKDSLLKQQTAPLSRRPRSLGSFFS